MDKEENSNTSADTKKEDKAIKNKEEKSKKNKDNKLKKKEEKYGDNETGRFNLLVKKNKASNRPWYYGLDGNWWWGITEEEARIRIVNAQKAFDNSLKMPIGHITKKKDSGSEQMVVAPTKEDIKKQDETAEDISEIPKVEIKKEDIKKQEEIVENISEISKVDTKKDDRSEAKKE